MNTKQIGDISEASLLSALLIAGYTVSVPWGDNARYDLVIDKDNKLQRVQVKTGRVRAGCIRFKVSSINVRTGTTSNYHGDVDYFGVYVPDNDKCYLVPVNDAANTSMYLRLEPTKNNQDHLSAWASDYEL